VKKIGENRLFGFGLALACIAFVAYFRLEGLALVCTAVMGLFNHFVGRKKEDEKEG
jgi:hypothetical protein